MSLSFLVVVAVMAAGLFASPALAAPTQYTVIDLGGLGGNISRGAALNNLGHASGYGTKVAGGVNYPWVWNGSTLKQVCGSTFRNDGATGVAEKGPARRMNSSDKLVGTQVTSAKVKGQTVWTVHLATCQGTTQTDLGASGGCDTDTYGASINDAGVATGFEHCTSKAFVYRNGVFTSFSLGGKTQPQSINSTGTVVGAAADASGTAQPFIYDGSTLRRLGGLPICTALGFTPAGTADDINDLGDIVGDSCYDPFFYSNGQMIDLGLAPGSDATIPHSINKDGEIVGQARCCRQNSQIYDGKAAVYDWADQTWYDLNYLASPIPSGFVLENALAINDSGTILVDGWIPTPIGTPLSGQTWHAFLLMPVNPSPGAAPANSGKPEITGLPVSGDLLTANVGVWVGAPSSYSYQWMRCSSSGLNCTDIAGSTSSTYRLTAIDVGWTIRLRVGATNEYGSASAQSDATAAIETPLDAFSPQLWYDSQETYRADSAAELTNNCWTDGAGNLHNNILYDSTGTPIASACPQMDPPYPGPVDQLSLTYLGPNYSSGNQAASTDHISEYFAQVDDFQRMHTMSEYGNRIYGRVHTYPDGDSILQYWFWYYNQPNFVVHNTTGGHEGDWEGIQIHLDPNGNPVDATYDQHGGGELCDWSRVTRYGLHPIAFVADNSHASYFTTVSQGLGGDSANGGAGPVTPTVEQIYDTSPAWLFWPGMWGGSTDGTLWEQTSPTGPGQKQDQWLDPLAWQRGTSISACSVSSSMHTLPSSQPSGSVTPTVTNSTVPAPRVRARRVGRRAVVSYCFAKVPTSRTRRPAVMEVSVQSANRDIPPYTTHSRAHLPCGRVTQPVGLGRRPFHVLVSAWTRSGARSRVVTVPLR